MNTEEKPTRLRLAVLASGRGSNLQSLLDAGKQADFPAEVVAVIGDNSESQALERARKAGVDTRWVDPGGGDYEDRLCREVESAQPGLICCAGYMRILPSAFVRRFPGKIINIHPSLLPGFPGLRAQRKALRAGVRVSGCTVHFIDEGVDTGPIILQAAVAVLPNDGEESLSQRILRFEHRLYPLAVRLIAEGKVRLEGNRVHFADDMASEIPDGFISPQPKPS